MPALRRKGLVGSKHRPASGSDQGMAVDTPVGRPWRLVDQLLHVLHSLFAAELQLEPLFQLHSIPYCSGGRIKVHCGPTAPSVPDDSGACHRDGMAPLWRPVPSRRPPITAADHSGRAFGTFETGAGSEPVESKISWSAMSENRLTNTTALLRKIRNAVQQCEMNCAKYLQCRAAPDSKYLRVLNGHRLPQRRCVVRFSRD
jgi:hypothetical protein